MSRLITFLLLSVTSWLTVAASGPLAVEALFYGRFRTDSRVTETTISGSSLADYNLTFYKSLTFVGAPDLIPAVEKAVTRDGAGAGNREVSYQDGHLYYGFYALPSRDNLKRYIFYLNRASKSATGKVILIYVEGHADINQIKRMLKK